jgi:hypothetical protein
LANEDAIPANFDNPHRLVPLDDLAVGDYVNDLFVDPCLAAG